MPDTLNSYLDRLQLDLNLYNEAQSAGFTYIEALTYAGMPTFSTVSEALDYVKDYVEDSCVDNERFAFYADTEAILEYECLKNSGCCAIMDINVIVDGRLATVGCNYGH